MDSQIKTANISRNPKHIRKFYASLFPILSTLILIIGLTVNNSFMKDFIQIRFFDWYIYQYWADRQFTTYIDGYPFTYSIPYTKWYIDNIIIITSIFIIVSLAPFIISAIYKRMCKNTLLFVDNEKIWGSYNSFVFKKTLQIPLEKVDNLTISHTLFDKLRTGKTLGVCSASGIIKLHFIQNAEEIVSYTMNQINELKSKNNQVHTTSISDKLKELANIKELGLITEDEFTKKREELLSKM